MSTAEALWLLNQKSVVHVLLHSEVSIFTRRDIMHVDQICIPSCAIACVNIIIFLSSRPGGKVSWFVRSLVLMAKERKRVNRGKKARKERKERKEKRRRID